MGVLEPQYLSIGILGDQRTSLLRGVGFRVRVLRVLGLESRGKVWGSGYGVKVSGFRV